MNKEEIIFDKTTESLGGKFTIKENQLISCILLNCREIGLELLKTIRLDVPIPKIHIDFIDSLSFNACAFKEQDIYFIGINVGAIRTLHAFFNYLLSFPDVLDFVGDNTKEISPVLMKSDDFKLFVKPKDKIREIYAKGLFVFAVRFLIIHELAHILNGHLDLKKNEQGIPFMSEVSSDSEIESDNNFYLNSQTLEYDADCYAANICIKIIIASFKSPESINTDIKPFFESLEEALFLWSFSSYSIFRLLGNNRKYDSKKLDKYPHPYPGFRQFWIYSMVETIIEGTEYSHLIEKIIDKSNNSILEFEKAIQIFNACPVKISFLDDINGFPIKEAASSEGLNHMLKVENNWNVLRPLLEPFSTAGLASLKDINEE